MHSTTKVREKSLKVNLCNVANDQICLWYFSHQDNTEYREEEEAVQSGGSCSSEKILGDEGRGAYKQALYIYSIFLLVGG